MVTAFHLAPAAAGKMFELTDSIGNKLFETISITLVCLAHRPACGHAHVRLVAGV
tara:strand:- start:284 stop:448 length:165 start_codon:yes stop_codon:yes gene_type:complete